LIQTISNVPAFDTSARRTLRWYRALGWGALVALSVTTALGQKTDLPYLDESQISRLGWGELSRQQECPDINGEFKWSGEQYFVSIDDGGAPRAARKDSRPFFFFSGVRANTSSVREVLAIQMSNDGFEATGRTSVGAVAIAKTLRASADFSCSRGLVVLRDVQSSGYTDGSQRTYAAQTSIGRLSDGSLFAFEATVSRRVSMFVFRGVRTTATYHRFERTDVPK